MLCHEWLLWPGFRMWSILHVTSTDKWYLTLFACIAEFPSINTGTKNFEDDTIFIFYNSQFFMLFVINWINSVNRRTFRECSIFWPTNTLLSYNGASLGRFQGFRESNSDGILWLSVIVYRSVFRHTLYCKADAVNLLSYISTVFITVVTVSWEIKQLWELFMNSHSFTCLQTKLRFY